MELQPPTEQDKNRSDSTARRENEGLPGFRYLFFGRRKEVRRNEDNRKSYFLDHYSLRVFGIIIGIILLSLTDAMLTLYLIRNGAAEVNRKSYFLDHYSLRVFGIIIGIILLSLTDAMLTLYLIRNGAAEVNPVMEHFLRYGPLPFLAAKYLLTTASIVLLLIYKNVHIFGTKIRAKYLFIIIFLIFASVVIWELFLIFFVIK